MSSRWERLAPLMGVGFVVLFVVGVVLGWNTPNSGDSPTKVLSYYQSHHSKIQASSYLTGLSLFFGVFWFGYVRTYLRDRGQERLGTVGFGGGILFAVGGGLAAGTQFALSDKPLRMTAATAQSLNLLENDLFIFLILAGLATMLFAYGTGAMRSRALMPRWAAGLTMAFGIFSLTPIGWLSLFYVAIWSLVLSIALYRGQSAATESPAAPPVAEPATVG